MNQKSFRKKLTTALVAELTRWEYRFHVETILVLDLGCYPDHGYLELSVLTDRESPHVQTHPSDTAAWRWYDFTRCDHSKWPAVVDLMEWMKSAVEADEDTWPIFFDECARALNSDEVTVALEKYRKADEFVRTVFDPEREGRNLCTDAPVDYSLFFS